ncbi:MAG: chromate transporter [Candidatus Eremiobacteraeota bacterium]|nr:chromate transporter [Candidatus Eremiobacteraeota bacterium]
MAQHPSAFETIVHLLWTFSQLSVLGFGGGKGIIPQMHTEAVGRYHWVTSQQFTQFYTIGKLMPGPTTIFAALIGYAATPARPYLGAAVATIAMFVPSSAIMVGFDALWDRFQASPWRAIIGRGLTPAIVGLVWSSVVTIGRGAPKGVFAYAIAAVVALLMLRSKIGTPLLILLAGAVGVAALR